MKLRRGGFSLIEVAVSIGLAGFVLSAMLGALPMGLRQNAISRHETRAAHLARTVFAELRSQSLSGSESFGELKVSPSVLRTTGAAPLFYAGFPVDDAPKIGAVKEAWAEYQIALQCDQVGTAISSEPASRVTLVIGPLDRSGRFEFISVVEDGQ